MRKYPLILVFGFLILADGCAIARKSYQSNSLSTKDFLLRLDGKPDLTVAYCGVEFDFSSYLGEDPEIEVRSHIEEAHRIEMRSLDDDLLGETKYSAESSNENEKEIKLHFFHASRARLKNEGVRFLVTVFKDSGAAKRVCVCDVKLTD